MLQGRDDQAAIAGGVRVRLRARPKRGLPDAPVEGVGEPVPRAAAEHGGEVGAQDAAWEGEEQDEDKADGREDSVGFHADTQELFQTEHKEACDISLSLGGTRLFRLCDRNTHI